MRSCSVPTQIREAAQRLLEPGAHSAATATTAASCARIVTPSSEPTGSPQYWPTPEVGPRRRRLWRSIHASAARNSACEVNVPPYRSRPNRRTPATVITPARCKPMPRMLQPPTALQAWRLSSSRRPALPGWTTAVGMPHTSLSQRRWVPSAARGCYREAVPRAAPPPAIGVQALAPAGGRRRPYSSGPHRARV